MSNKIKPRLRCRKTSLQRLAKQYSYARNDEALIALQSSIQSRGYLTHSDLETLAKWKAPRSAGRIRGNSKEYVREITSIALSANTERARIETLTLLDGVGWPTASVILHYYHREPYPIIDFRALWTVSLDVPNQYNIDVWTIYVDFCRELSRDTGMSMRELDKALWQYSKENQR